jgi:hypothetical protein
MEIYYISSAYQQHGLSEFFVLKVLKVLSSQKREGLWGVESGTGLDFVHNAGVFEVNLKGLALSKKTFSACRDKKNGLSVLM